MFAGVYVHVYLQEYVFIHVHMCIHIYTSTHEPSVNPMSPFLWFLALAGILCTGLLRDLASRKKSAEAVALGHARTHLEPGI